jgi:hypothetical protein
MEITVIFFIVMCFDGLYFDYCMAANYKNDNIPKISIKSIKCSRKIVFYYSLFDMLKIPFKGIGTGFSLLKRKH